MFFCPKGMYVVILQLISQCISPSQHHRIQTDLKTRLPVPYNIIHRCWPPVHSISTVKRLQGANNVATSAKALGSWKTARSINNFSSQLTDIWRNVFGSFTLPVSVTLSPSTKILNVSPRSMLSVQNCKSQGCISYIEAFEVRTVYYSRISRTWVIYLSERWGQRNVKRRQRQTTSSNEV